MSTALRTYYRGATLVGMRDEVAQKTSYYHFDHQGTTQCLTDETGAVTDRFACDAWGVPVKRTGNSINRHWYIGNSGYYRSEAAALDYARLRYLKPSIGRWIAQAPPSPEDRVYQYAHNQPARGSDPFEGLDVDGRPEGRQANPHCFRPAYDALRQYPNPGYCPEKACNLANARCGTHFRCGVCGPGPDPDVSGTSCAAIIHDHNVAMRMHDDCGGHGPGYEGADKLAHCWGACMAFKCDPLWGCVAAVSLLSYGEDDPLDVAANYAGSSCGTQHALFGHYGRECLACCRTAVYHMVCRP